MTPTASPGAVGVRTNHREMVPFCTGSRRLDWFRGESRQLRAPPARVPAQLGNAFGIALVRLGGESVTDPGTVLHPVQRELVLKGRILPWILTIVVALTFQRFAYFLNDISVLSGNLTQDVILFCGVISCGVAPRAFPNAVRMKVTHRGLNVRDVFVFVHANWDEVAEPFEWRRTLLGELVVCRCWSSLGMRQIQFYNNFEIPTSILVDLLNLRWRSSKGHVWPSELEGRTEG
jgi:hypothetical protein